MKKLFYMLALLSASYAINAQDCQTILAKLPSHANEQTTFVEQIKAFEGKCKARENGSDPAAFNSCMNAGMASLGISGNYIAMEILAKMQCHAGQLALSKQWMKAVLNSPYAPPADKEIAQKIIDLEGE